MVVYAFWTVAFLILYVYVGYPLLLSVLSRLRPIPARPDPNDDCHPSVSLIIAAYNEERVVAEKIENALHLDYPKDNLEIIVFSDASSDRTDEIVQDYADKGVRLLRVEGRRGKTFCKNEAVRIATGVILVFSDANSMYETEAIRKLVRHFVDPSVGCVSGELRYRDEPGTVQGETLYWKYEQWLKRLESAIGSLTSANGAIYAVRREAYEPLPVDVIDDFGASLSVRRKGFRVIYEPEAVAWETTAADPAAEFGRRVRMVTRATYALFWNKDLRKLLNPAKYGFFAVQVWSHKILRWLTGIFLMALVALNALLVNVSWVYITFLVGQLLFYGLAVVGLLDEKGRKRFPRIVHAIYYFCLSCIAMLQGFYRGMRGRTLVSWTPNR